MQFDRVPVQLVWPGPHGGLLEVQADLTNNGQLDLAILGSDFDSPPVVEGQPPEFWQKLLDALTGVGVNYANGMTQLRADVQTQVVGSIMSELNTSLQHGQPGGHHHQQSDQWG
jgi:hypothetical protein